MADVGGAEGEFSGSAFARDVIARNSIDVPRSSRLAFDAARTERLSAISALDVTPRAEPLPADRTQRKRNGLAGGDQRFILVVIAVALLLMAAHWVRLSGWGRQTIEIEQLAPRETEFHVDVNTATWVEWAQLEGIGPALAKRIVEDRERNGPFAGIDDIERVRGIGPKRLEKLRPWLTIKTADSAESSNAAAEK